MIFPKSKLTLTFGL